MLCATTATYLRFTTLSPGFPNLFGSRTPIFECVFSNPNLMSHQYFCLTNEEGQYKTKNK